MNCALLTELVDRRGRGRFVGDEAAGLVGAVAEGALGGLAAAAERDGRLVRRDLERLAAGIDQRKGTFDDQWPVGAHADFDFGHLASPTRQNDWIQGIDRMKIAAATSAFNVAARTICG